jgi:hypothetical protein
MTDRLPFLLTATAVGLALAVGAREPWDPAGPPVLDEPPTAWTTSAAPGASAEVRDDHVALRVGRCEPPCRAEVARELPLDGGPWLVIGDVTRGKPGRRTRLFLEADGRRHGGEQAPLGPAEVRAVADVVVHGTATVGAVAVGPWAELDVGRIRVVPARRSALRIALSGAAIVAFASAAVAGAAALARSPLRVAFAVVAAGVAIGVLLPAGWLDALLLAIVPGATPEDLGGSLLHEPSAPVLVQKLAGHGGGFLLVGALAGASSAPVPLALARIGTFAAATEAAQVLVPGRSAQLVDLGVDLVAAGLGYALVTLGRAALRAPRRSAASPP